MDLSPLHALDLSAPGSLLMVIGAPDSGKSTLARQIYQELCRQYSCIAYLDGDPGQSLLGPPTTLSLAINRRGDLAFPPRGRIWRRFLGATSPRGHMLPMLVGIHRLVSTAREHGAQIVVYDTCGFVSAHEGGLALKLAEMELLRPSMVIALQRETELEPLLQVARASSIRTVRLAPSPRVQPRPPEQRRKYRAQRFQEYFREAQRWVLDKNSLAIVASFPLQPAQLVSLEDAQGFVLRVGRVTGDPGGTTHAPDPAAESGSLSHSESRQPAPGPLHFSGKSNRPRPADSEPPAAAGFRAGCSGKREMRIKKPPSPGEARICP
jgi:energy-coupling factor transporter ATP-binding protein EcfA2